LTLNCIIVDDSKIQRLSIVKLVENHTSLNLIAEFNSALECKGALKTYPIDLIFLDIEMPNLSGFEFLDTLTKKPQIIFITGKTEYAFKAFNYDATDYLHKPIKRERFNAAIEKAIKHHNLKLGVYDDGDDEYLIIKSNSKKHQIYFKDIKWLKALGDYVQIITEGNTFTVLTTMKSLETELPEDQFLRIHKSYTVNLAKIDRFSSTKVEVGEFEIPLSRNKKKYLAEALELDKN
jgi:two-component system LytT family response regulator